MVSVVVCTYNRAQYLARTLQHLYSQDASIESFEVLVIDNNSSDGTKKVCEDFHTTVPKFPFRYILESNQGLSHARNRGIAESRGEVITFIDDDAFAEPAFVSSILNYMVNHSDVVAIGGKIIPQYEEKAPKWMSKYLLPLVAALDMGNETKEFAKNKFPIGANMSIRKSAFVTHGCFDINLGRRGTSLEGSEEKDLFFRIMTTGGKVMYLPQAVVHHIIPAKRVSSQYIRKQAIGIGKSESRRTRQRGKFTAFIFGELVKWAGTIVLGFLYLIILQPAKAAMLIKFRGYVTKGILAGD